MNLDIRSLLVATAVATGFSAGARILLWRLHPGMAGLGRWSAAGVIGALSMLLVAAGRLMESSWGLSAAELLVIFAFTLAWDGFRRFFGRAGLSTLALAGMAFALVVPLAVLVTQWRVVAQTTVNAALIALVSGAIAFENFRAVTPARRTPRAMGWLYVANTAFFLVRLRGSLAEGPGPGPITLDDFAAASLLWWLGMVMATTMGMALMAGEALQADLNRQASRDPLTGALNRRAFTQAAAVELARIRRSGRPLSVLMMDLDHFKAINDRLGHSAGDTVLCLFVELAERLLRAEDVLCRFGGEEFIALLPGSDARHAVVVAERIRAAYAEQATARDWVLPKAPTVSIGVSELTGGEDIDSMVRRADAALYRAKHNGRNRTELAETEDLELAAAPAG